MEQDKFEKQCRTRIFRFFKRFKTDTRRFNVEDKDRVREAHKWTDQESHVVKETKKDEITKVFVRYELC